MKKSTAKRLLRIVPIAMQLFGALGAGVGGWYSLATLMGSGIGSPTGQADVNLYSQAVLLTGGPALIALIGWLWVTIGYLAAPVRDSFDMIDAQKDSFEAPETPLKESKKPNKPAHTTAGNALV